MAQPDLEVVGVVGRGDLHGARAELGVDVRVGHDHDPGVEERVHQGLPDQRPVAVVVGVHRHGGVAEHGLHPGGGDHDVRFVVVHRAVPERNQFALDVELLDLQVEIAVSSTGDQLTNRSA